ncbi:MAG: AAA family ATPase, partial [Acidobacteriales bacterium]|nr:AAA family ATPase [Terriglobales bacterium]
MASAVERLKVYIKSSSPIVVIETLEEVRALEVAKTAASDLDLAFFEWSIADGLTRTDGSFSKVRVTSEMAPSLPPINNTQPAVGLLAHMRTLTIEGVFVLKDFHRHMEDTVVIRRLREVAQTFCTDRRTVIITAPALAVPPELQNQVEYLDLPLPDSARLAQIVEETYARLRKKLLLARTIDKTGIATLADNLSGLTEDEAERAVAHAIVSRNILDEQVPADVLQAKKDMLKRSGMLDFIENPEAMNAVGGLDNLKRWLVRRKNTWTEAARAAGLEAPRGVIIMGVQGCGKSMCARAVAGEWGLPLVRFDTAAIYDKYVGETEKRIQKVFRVAERLAPAVLWIDELEKVFAGSGADSASADAGVSARLLAAFLSWMQDRKAPV